MKYIFYVLLVVCLSSCGVKYKTIPYFSDLPADSLVSEQIQNNVVLRVKKNDILAINVSSLNPEASAIFNLGTTTSNQGANSGNTNSIASQNGFLVDSHGAIQLPLVGDVDVSGKTTAEIRSIIEEKLNDYLKEPVVSVRLVNFHISVLGDVARPGVYPINSEQINLSEALSMAGDLNITAIRNNVLLIREQDGERKYIRLNLQSRELFNSPYYYLNNNDVIYIQPSSSKYASVDSNYRNLSILLSALSVIAVIISRF
ncbi:polysaccharide biosynthesis/export family protein [Pedobacter deserti]|uniref:polysaccharide biosynthesis/export family protein n=1 Tax=Pedobacter deserti TaxID=2817382 RepID=UPI00210B7ED7|nr:polysaccharide biosynthesis/export family protein [Pedobacter sp. SYSU D00382]